MPSPERELKIPRVAAGDAGAFEILRVWAAQGEQHVTIRSNLAGGPEEFGFLLAQLARHGANLFRQRDALGWRDALRRIRAGLDDEWKNPTPGVTGRIPD